jgi:hypothetical protein
MRQFGAAAAIALGLMVAFAGHPSAQRVPKRVYAEVLSGTGAPILDLKAEEFNITEDGERREVTRVTPGDAPMRIVLMVDSSTSTQPMMTMFRTALLAFVDALPQEHEVVFVSSGGQIRVRTQPSTDRSKLKNDIGLLNSEGGANAYLETMIEADQRFLKPAAGRWPVFIILTTDIGEARREPDIPRYNRFMNDFLARGGNAHAIVMQGKQFGPVTDVTRNLVQNTGGIYMPIIVDSALPKAMRSLADRLAEDAQLMRSWYEVEFSGNAKLQQPTVEVGVRRDAVTVRMSARRPPA